MEGNTISEGIGRNAERDVENKIRSVQNGRSVKEK